MSRITIDVAQLRGLARAVRAVTFVRRLAIAGTLGVAAIVALLARGGFSMSDGVLAIVLLIPSAILLFFAQGVQDLLSLPDRVLRMPREGQERLSELTRLAGEGTTRMRRMPRFIWRLGSNAWSVRDVVGIAVRLRVLTPTFLVLVGVSALACVVLAGVGVIALLVLAAG